ncbi:sulfatase-like hydrolase/transferase [Endozoicomonas arenosclerae]|uniref:sulfatase-like hydrolase/transferase n=1 Tax=Endozoicomonas arenosclerae TaxID=1633495 RepID=UPI000780E9B4|nr:sulfatase-like hydrolase/transferase [Endozoicomonas arenosclerae]
MKKVRTICRSLLFGATAAAMAQSAIAEQPNVMLILADDMGWKDASYHGAEFDTPSLDKIAAEGVELRRMYVNPKCSPTRGALLTGRDPIRFGMGYATVYPWVEGGIPKGEKLIGEYFQEAGYHTAAFGKWNVGHTFYYQHPNQRGFDYFFGHLNTNGDYYDHTVNEVGGFDLQRNGTSVDRKQYVDRSDIEKYGPFVLANDANQWLDDWSSKQNDGNPDNDGPFMMYVPFKAPHSPLQAPQSLIDEAENSQPGEIRNAKRKIFAGMMLGMDKAIGRMMDKLEELGVADNTIVMFLSDNGGTGTYQGGGLNTPLRGYKQQIYEGGIRVVGMIRYPGSDAKKPVLKPGTQSEQFITGWDVLPTLADAAGVDYSTSPEGRPLDGKSYWPQLTSNKPKPYEGDIYFATQATAVNQFAFTAIRGNMKLVQLVDMQMESVKVTNELYDIIADPSETKDLSAKPEHAELLTDLITDVEAWRNDREPFVQSRIKVVPHPGWVAPADWAEFIKANSAPGVLQEYSQENQWGEVNVIDSSAELKARDEQFQKAHQGRLIVQ